MTLASSALNVEVSGAGPPLVLLHGWALNLRVFDPVAVSLARQFTLHAVDLPGHGRSRAPLLVSGIDVLAAELLQHLPAQFHLCGWSLGGLLAMAMAAHAPQRLLSLTLVASTPRFMAGDDWPHGVRSTVLQAMAQRLNEDAQGAVHDMLELQVRGSRHPAAVLQQLRRALQQQGIAPADTLAAGLQLLGDTDLRALVPRITTRTLVMSGQYDRVTHPAASRWLAQQLPQAALREFARCGHAPFLSHPAEFVDHFCAFATAAMHSDRAQLRGTA